MTQHQAPEVTSELRECPLCNRAPKRNGRAGAGGVICRHAGHLVQVYGASQADADKNWNNRATQPLSLTVDDETIDIVARIIAPEWFLIDEVQARLHSNIVYGNRQQANAKARTILDRLQSLALPVDIDRSGLAQEVE